MELSHAPTNGSPRPHLATRVGSHPHFYAWCLLALSVTLFVELICTVAFAEVVFPLMADHPYSHLICNIASGVFASVTLFAIFITEHRHRNDRAQRETLQKLQRESATGCRVIDQDTNTFTREYFDHVLLREIGRTSISAKSFCVLRCALSHSIQGPQKDVVSSFLEGRLAQILRSSVRASDVIAHTAKCEFTIILPELNEHLARIPLERIRRAAERWNKNSGLQYRMRIKFGLCEYERTTTPQQLLSEVAHRCHVDQFSRTTTHQYIPPAHRLEYTPADDQRPVC